MHSTVIITTVPDVLYRRYFEHKLLFFYTELHKAVKLHPSQFG